MIKPVTAYAVVSKKNPRIDIYNIFSKEQIKEIGMDKDNEMIVEVIIQARK